MCMVEKGDPFILAAAAAPALPVESSESSGDGVGGTAAAAHS